MFTLHPAAQGLQARPKSVTAIIGSLIMALAFGCAQRGEEGREASRVVATIGTRNITQEELEGRVRGELTEIDTARYDVLKTGLDELIKEILLEQEAKARNVTTDELIKVEVTDKVEALNTTEPIGSKEVERFYEKYKQQLGGQPLDPLRPAIKEHLQAQRAETRRAAFTDALRQKSAVVVSLRPPKLNVSEDGPSRGPADAAVTIVEFSDFECPFCKNAAETVEQLMEQYKGKVRLVYRHFPLPIHNNAQQAAEAAACANEGGKFWEYHDLLFRNQNALAKRDDLIRYAREAGIDEATFVSCLESGRGTSVVEKDRADGEAAGVNGTPSFFVNGRPLSGAQPYDAFREAIDDELAWKNR